MFLLSKSAVRWCVRFCIWCSCILSQHNKNEEHSKEHSSFLVRLVQTYSVFKQIAKSICNEYSICFSSQKLPYGGASVFVYGVLAYFHNIIKTRNILKNIPRFWYVSSKHIPYSNKLPSQFVTNTPYVSPLKNCRTVVRQFLYYGVRVPTTQKIIKKPSGINT